MSRMPFLYPVAPERPRTHLKRHLLMALTVAVLAFCLAMHGHTPG